ncbi:AtpZ/AtpI family protein [Gracilibacillus sp. YIM 98692]|uniref:AtpZ/AtpI family protein n=1 Tax=Gracilibacillus sp. YIM 98692 TaxID=2663532 RepID=UPI0013CF8629|nr:AtpZ/AtpI family protein [Gracilibacillus sp. YIM 98692]
MSQPPQKNPFRGLAIGSTILSQLVGGPLVGIFLGKWLDQHLSTSPLCLVLGLLLGLGAGLYGTIHFIRKLTGE